MANFKMNQIVNLAATALCFIGIFGLTALGLVALG